MPRLHWLWIAGLAAAVAVAVVAPAHVRAQDGGQIRDLTGKVVNGTAGSLPPFGVAVTLHRQGSGIYEEESAITDTEGGFRFEDIPLDPDSLYGVTVRYQGVVYGTDVDLRPESLPPVVITIYETSDDQSILGVSSSSLLIPQVDKIERDIYALEIVMVVNPGDRTYVPGAEPMNLLRFGLPDGARGLQIDTALPTADAIQVDRGFGLTANVPPGEHEVMFAYNFDYEGQSVVFEKSYLYGAENVRVLVPYEVGDLSSVEFGGPGDVLIGGKRYQLLEVSDVARQTRATMQISSLPQAAFWEIATDAASNLPYELTAPALLGVLLLCIVGYGLTPHGRRLWRRASGPRSSNASSARTDVVERIADLDEAFEAGRLREADYHAKRQALLDSLPHLRRIPSND